MPSLEQLYRQDPESLAFRQPVDIRVVLVSLCCWYQYLLQVSFSFLGVDTIPMLWGHCCSI